MMPERKPTATWTGVRFDHAMLVTPAGVLMTFMGRKGSFRVHSVMHPSPCCLTSLLACPTASTHDAACKHMHLSSPLWLEHHARVTVGCEWIVVTLRGLAILPHMIISNQNC